MDKKQKELNQSYWHSRNLAQENVGWREYEFDTAHEQGLVDHEQMTWNRDGGAVGKYLQKYPDKIKDREIQQTIDRLYKEQQVRVAQLFPEALDFLSPTVVASTLIKNPELVKHVNLPEVFDSKERGSSQNVFAMLYHKPELAPYFHSDFSEHMENVSIHDDIIPKILGSNYKMGLKYPVLLSKIGTDIMYDLLKYHPKLIVSTTADQTKHISIPKIIEIYKRSQDDPETLKLLNMRFSEKLKQLPSVTKQYYKMN